MDPRFRSRLIAAIVLLIVVCSAFSVSPVAGFRLENRDGSGTDATLAEALVLQQSTRIREEFIKDITVYIDSRNRVFAQQGTYGNTSALYVPAEDAIYIRSDRHPAQADEAFARQVGYRVYHTMRFSESTVFPALDAGSGPCMARLSIPPGEEREAALFAEAFMLYHASPALLKEDAPTTYAYMDLLVKSGGDCAAVDGLYTHGRPA